MKVLFSDRIAKKVYAGGCVGSLLIGRLRKRWTDSMNDWESKKDVVY